MRLPAAILGVLLVVQSVVPSFAQSSIAAARSATQGVRVPVAPCVLPQALPATMSSAFPPSPGLGLPVSVAVPAVQNPVPLNLAARVASPSAAVTRANRVAQARLPGRRGASVAALMTLPQIVAVEGPGLHGAARRIEQRLRDAEALRARAPTDAAQPEAPGSSALRRGDLPHLLRAFSAARAALPERTERPKTRVAVFLERLAQPHAHYALKPADDDGDSPGGPGPWRCAPMRCILRSTPWSAPERS